MNFNWFSFGCYFIGWSIIAMTIRMTFGVRAYHFFCGMFFGIVMLHTGWQFS